jgi:hypothetical protein
MTELILTAVILFFQCILMGLGYLIHLHVKKNGKPAENLVADLEDIIVEEIRLQDDRIQKRIQRLTPTKGTDPTPSSDSLRLDSNIDAAPRFKPGQSVRREGHG